MEAALQYIERLNTDDFTNQTKAVLSRATMVSCLVGNELGKMHNIADSVVAHVNNRVRVGSLYGITGVPLSALNKLPDNTYIEVSATLFVQLPKNIIEYVLQHANLIINDMIDGGMILNYSVAKVFSNMRIPHNRKIKYVTSSTDMNSFLDFNITHKHFPYWLFSVPTIPTEYSMLVNDATAKQQYLDLLDSRQHTDFAVFMNYKPRLYRMIMLAEMHKRGVLNLLDWSLVESSPEFTPDGNISTGDADMIHQNNQRLYTEQEARSVEQFMLSHTFPKRISDTNNLTDFLVAPNEHIKKWKYNVVVETAFGNEYALRRNNAISFLTEKTYKSFMQGSMPISVCNGKQYKYLTDLGFCVDFAELDDVSEPRSKIDTAINLIQKLHTNSTTPDPKSIMHNAERILDKQWLVSVFSEYLLDMVND